MVGCPLKHASRATVTKQGFPQQVGSRRRWRRARPRTDQEMVRQVKEHEKYNQQQETADELDHQGRQKRWGICLWGMYETTVMQSSTDDVLECADSTHHQWYNLSKSKCEKEEYHAWQR